MITRSYAFFMSEINRLSLSSSHFQSIKLVELLFTKYKSKLIKVTLVSIHTTIDMCQLFYESLSRQLLCLYCLKCPVLLSIVIIN